MGPESADVHTPPDLPGLIWHPSAVLRYAEVGSFLLESPDIDAQVRSAIGEELQQNLDYLSKFGGDEWTVALFADDATLSFRLRFVKKGEEGVDELIVGRLQCDAVQHPHGFGSVVLGKRTYWSIHT